jgi:hypothetical protein
MAPVGPAVAALVGKMIRAAHAWVAVGKRVLGYAQERRCDSARRGGRKNPPLYFSRPFSPDLLKPNLAFYMAIFIDVLSIAANQ